MDVSIGKSHAKTGTLPGAVLVRMGALLLTAVAISANFTDYGALIPLMQSTLHISSGEAGLFSTLLYGGIACTYLPGGMLADRYGSRRVLIGSLLLIGLGGCLLPLFGSLAWMLLCRAMIGLGSGAAIVAGSQAAARLGTYAALGQGLYGGAMQAGAGLGLFLTPQLLARVGWRGTFVCWGLFGVLVCLLWLYAIPEARAASLPIPPRHLSAGWHTPAIWCLGLVHLGTLGMGQAIAPWLALYFAAQCGLPVPLAAMLGSIGLFAGMVFRPLGGVLLTRKVFSAVALMRVGTLLSCVGVGLLALPTGVAPLVGAGIALLSFGTTFPYAAVFSEAGRVGQMRGIGTGTAQGMVSLLSAPASSLGPPLIGLLLARQGGFSTAFGALALVGLLPVSAALLAGPVLLYATKRQGRNAWARARDVHPSEGSNSANSSRERDREVQAAIASLRSRQHLRLPARFQPLIALFDFCSQSQGEQRYPWNTDAPVVGHLLEAGGMPVLFPAPAPGLHAESFDLLADEQLFGRAFDQVIWPLFSQLVFHQIKGICLTGSPVREGGGCSPVQKPVPLPWGKVIARYIGLLAWLVGMPVLGERPEIQRFHTREGHGEKEAAWSFWADADLQRKGSSQGEVAASEPVVAAFLAACSAYTPPPLESLQPLRAEIGAWLRRRDHERLREMPRSQLMTAQKAKGRKREANPAAQRVLNARLKARQHKLNTMRSVSLPLEKKAVALATA